MTPSAEQVAERAGIGLRSVFRHFKDMDTLYREMSDALAATIEGVVRRPFKASDWQGQGAGGGGPARRRVREAGAVHARGAGASATLAFLKRGHERFVKALREILIGLLPAKIARQSQLVEALDMLLSFEAWQRLREDQNLDVARARRVLKATIASLLREHADA